MTLNKEDILNSILESLSEMEPLSTSEFPGINLYMDQLTTFMDSHLAHTKRYADDKVLTKTMINNYAKNNILPSPDKKQYSSSHLVTLIFIYYFKNILSITDIQKLLEPIEEKYFDQDKINLRHIYSEVFSMEDEALKKLRADVEEKYATSRETFAEVPEKDRDLLQKFAFICELCFDVYLKKTIVEKLIDDLPDSKQDSKKQKAAQKATKDKSKK